jgi:thiol-disulfide isomerase/thioredoxin
MDTQPRDDRAPDKPRPSVPRGVWWAIALAIVVLAVAGLKATSTGTSSTDAPTLLDPNLTQPTDANPLIHTATPVGKPVPAATFDRFDGARASFADYAGQPLVINFWSSTCTPCLAEMPDLESVHQQYGGRVAFVGVDVKDALSSGQSMAAKTGVSYDLVRDPDGSLIGSVGGAGLPTTLLVKADGTIVRVAGPGAIRADDLRRWIDQDLLS